MAREPLLIADAGPIILLAAIARFDLLRSLGLEVMIPRSVYDEVVAGAPRPGSERFAVLLGCKSSMVRRTWQRPFD
jgi:predicted nucleic acid-binding protein